MRWKIKNHTQIGEWCFEVTEVRARKTKAFGEPYTATGIITIADGEPHVEMLLAIDGISSTDKSVLQAFLESMGFDGYTSSKIENDERTINRIKFK